MSANFTGSLSAAQPAEPFTCPNAPFISSAVLESYSRKMAPPAT